MSVAPSFTLYYHPLASYCHKVLIALYENNIAFKARIIDLGADNDRAELGALWPLCKFPVLRDHANDRNLPVLTTRFTGLCKASCWTRYWGRRAT